MKNKVKVIQLSEDKCNIRRKEPRFKVRYLAILFGFMVEFFFYYHRIVMSVSIVAMVNSSVSFHGNETPSQSCENLIEYEEAKNNSTEKLQHGEFQWSPKFQGYILGSSFICYIIAVPFLSRLTEMYGAKKVIFMCHFLSSLFTFLSPFAARLGIYALILMQSLRGMSQGGILPTEAVLIANWCPKQERGLALIIVMCGSAFGASFGSYVTGIICDSAVLGGWSSAFYVSGGMGLIVAIIIWFFLYDNPSVHPKLSPAEFAYIINNQENALTEKRPKTPWKSLFTSIPVYALGYALFGRMWAFSQFLTMNATFLQTILHYSIEQDGLMNALPFMLQIIFSQIGGILSTLLINKNYVSVDISRKFWNLLSTVGYSACILGICFADCNRSLITVLSIVALSFIGFGMAGSAIACNDMSPTFAASINAIASSIGSLAYFILPVVVGTLTNDAQTIEQWHKIFFICIAVVSSSGIVFMIFGSAEIQPWNDVPEEEQKKNFKTKLRF